MICNTSTHLSTCFASSYPKVFLYRIVVLDVPAATWAIFEVPDYEMQEIVIFFSTTIKRKTAIEIDAGRCLFLFSTGLD